MNLDLILGIRPDVIRASLIIKKLSEHKNINFRFIWSGQHYSINMKDVFFQQLDVKLPDIELKAKGETDAQFISSLIYKLDDLYKNNKPDASIFLGDTNTVLGSIACASNNIPIAHIEGCMRSYDWTMPEEKNRTIVDHLSNVIYAYLDDYKLQGLNEGIDSESIVVTGNIIVDVLNNYYFNNFENYEYEKNKHLFTTLGLKKDNYIVATIHRRENILNKEAIDKINKLILHSPVPILFIAGYRTQKEIAKQVDKWNKINIIDPIGYQELLTLMTNSCGVITDSGTIVEETSILGIPTMQVRKSTERPQVYDFGGTIKFDPRNDEDYYKYEAYFERLFKIKKNSWKHNLGRGNSSEIIVNDLLSRISAKKIKNSDKKYPFDTSKAFAPFDLKASAPEGI